MRAILIFIVLFYSICTFAQTEWTYKSVDSITYQQYKKKDFKNLKKTGEKALKKEIDFYYLRTRLGIAYFETKNYEKAVVHLKRALEMYPSEALIKEYYYFSLLNTLRTADAYDLANGFSKTLQNKIGFKKQNKSNLLNSFDNISVTTNIITNKNYLKKDDALLGDGIYTENTLTNTTSIGNLYVENSISNRVKIYNSFSYITINSTGIVQTLNSDTEKRDYNNTNLNYTLGGNYAIKNLFNVNLFGSFHQEQSNHLTATPNLSDFSLIYKDNNYQFHSYSAGVAFSKRIKNVGINTSFSVSNFSEGKQYQYGTSLLWYPFGNTNFYSNSSFTYLLNNTKKQYIYSQYVGFKLGKNTRFELNGSFGNHQNLISSNGLISYNTIDPIWFLGDAKLFLNYKNFTLIPSYGIQKREGSYDVYTSIDTFRTIKNKYNNNLYKFTILWKL